MGSNTITVDKESAYGIKLESGNLTIHKTTSDETDSLTVQTSGAGICAARLIEANTTVDGGTLNLLLKEGDNCVNALVAYNLIMKNASILNSTVENASLTVPYVVGTLDLETSGKTTIRAKGDADTMSAASTVNILGSGEISIEAENTRVKNGKPCQAEAALIGGHTGTSKFTAKGLVATSRIDMVYNWPGDIDVTNAPEGGWMLYYIPDVQYRRTYICDSTGTPLTQVILEKKTMAFSFTDSAVWDVPAMKVGEYYNGPYFAGGLHGVTLHSAAADRNDVKFQLKSGEKLPEGLNFGTWVTSKAHIYGTPTQPCEAGEAILVATKKSTGETVEITIKYGAVSEKDTFLTIADTAYNRKEDASGTNWTYQAADHTLTLNGYNGGSILSDGDLNVKLSGANTITVSADNTAGISLESGTLTIDKTDSDEDDALTITTSGTGIKAECLINGKTIVNGGTLNLKLLTGDTCKNDNYLVDYELYMENASVLNSEAISADRGIPRVAGQLYLENSGKTTIYAKGHAFSLNAAGPMSIFGSGEIDIEAVNTKTEDGKSCPAIAASIDGFGGTSKVTATGRVIAKNVDAMYGWPGNISITPVPAGGWMLHRIQKGASSYICDSTGTPLTALTIEKKDNVEFSFTDSDEWNIPLLKIGEYYAGNSLAGGEHGAYFHCEDASKNQVQFMLKSGEKLPDGLAIYNSTTSRARISGTPTKECEGGDVTLIAVHKDTKEEKEFTIHYEGVTVAKPVTSVSLSAETLNLAEKGSAALTATVAPEDATISTVAFRSSNTNVAKVSQEKDSKTAMVTAVGPGTAIITVTTTQGGLFKTCAVTVTPDIPSITFDVSNNLLLGFTPKRGYTIKDKDTGAVLKEIPDTSTGISLAVEDDWFGKTLSIVQISDGVASAACEVTVAHVFGADYKYDETKHWKPCVCGLKLEEEAHVFEWVIDVPATDNTNGRKHKECVCKYQDPNNKNIIIPASQLAGVTLNGITAPVVGATPAAAAESLNEDCYTVENAAWKLEGAALAADVVFERGKSYTLDVEIKLQGVYAFSADLSETAIVLGGIEKVAVSSRTLTVKDADAKIYTVSIVFAPLVDRITMTDANTVVTGIGESYEYTGRSQNPLPIIKVTVEEAAKTLVINTDYTIEYTNNKEPGSAEITIKGIGQYAGTLTKSFLIYRPISKLTLERKEYEYTGETIDPTGDLVLKHNSKVLVQGTDYVVDKVENNKNPGYMKITIKSGSNGFYTGSYTFASSIRILPQAYEIQVTNGKAYDVSGNEITKAAENTKVTIKANKPALGKEFEKWILSAGNVTIANTSRKETYFMMPGRTVSVEAVYRQLETIYAAPIEDQTYTGSAIKVLPKIYDGKKGGIELINKKDYTLSYKNNTNAGEATATFTGKGVYKNEKQTLTFRIVPYDITTEQNTLYVELINGKTSMVAPAVRTVINGKTKTLVKEKDYTLTYNYANNEVFNPSKEYKVTAVGEGNYGGSIEYKIVFMPKGAPKLAKAKVTLAYSKTGYDGTNKEPSVKVVLNKAELAPSCYTVEYRNNKEAGKASVTVIGNNTDVYGEKTLTFNITGEALTSAAQFVDLPAGVSYTGEAIEPGFRLVLKRRIGDRAAGSVLTEGVDYELVGYKNNVKPGKASVTVKGKGLFTGMASQSFKIDKVNLAAGITIIECTPNASYSKGGAIPASVVVKRGGKVLNPQIDYKLSYKNNKKIGTATLTVTGMGGYMKAVSKEYQVIPASFEDVISITASNVRAGTPYKKLRLTVKDGKAKLSVKEYSISYAVVGAGGSETPITDLNACVEEGKVIKITVTAKQGGNYIADTSKSILISV